MNCSSNTNNESNKSNETFEPALSANELQKFKSKTTNLNIQGNARKDSKSEKENEHDISRLDLRVGKIIEVSKHPNADTLYLEKIDVGEAQLRTVISGLVNYICIEELKNRLVVLLCNLKPVKMRGITSEAMVMCASTSEKVEVLSPPTSSLPGDLVYCDEFSRTPDVLLSPKKKVLEAILPDLKTNDNFEACYKGFKLIVGEKGPILSKTLKNVNIK